MASKKKKDIEILWEKKYWDKLINQIQPSKRLLIKKWFIFNEFVIFIKFDSDDGYNVEIKADIHLIDEKKQEKLIMKEMTEGRESKEIIKEIKSINKFVNSYFNKDPEMYIRILVEEELWPKNETYIDGRDLYEEYGVVDKNKKFGFVYFVRNDDIYKIGITNDLIRRFDQLKPDEVINTIRCSNYESLELDLHKKFKKYRIPQTEYFRLTPNLVEQVNSKMTEAAET